MVLVGPADLQRVEEALADELRRLRGYALGQALLAWLEPWRPECLSSLAQDAAARLLQGGLQPTDLAILGLALTRRPGDRAQYTIMREGLERLAQQKYFSPNQPRQLEANGDALLGLALGARALQDQAELPAATWLRDVLLAQVQKELPTDSWPSCVAGAGRSVLGQDAPTPADLRLVLAVKGLLSPRSRDLGDVLTLLAQGTPGLRGGQAAIRLAAARLVIRTRPDPDQANKRADVAITDFLAEHLSVDEMRRLVWTLPRGRAAMSALPEGALPRDLFARELVGWLMAQGLLDDDFFDRLLGTLPNLLVEVGRLQIRFREEFGDK